MDITMGFWRENVDKILTMNDQKLLTGPGRVSNAEMTARIKEIYKDFDAKRKAYEAQIADAQDIEEIEKLIKIIKKK